MPFNTCHSRHILMAGLLFFSGFAFAGEIHEINNENAMGCGDARILKRVELNGKKNTYVIVDIDTTKESITQETRTVDLSKSKNVTAILEVLNTEKGSNYCTDGLSLKIKTIKSTKITSGTLEIKKTKDEVKLKQFGNHIPYRINATLHDATFIIDGKLHHIKEVNFSNVLVSFMMG